MQERIEQRREKKKLINSEKKLWKVWERKLINNLNLRFVPRKKKIGVFFLGSKGTPGVMSTLNRLPCLKESRLWTQGSHQIRWSERRCRVLSSSTASTSGFHPGWKDQSPPDHEVCPGWIQVGDAIWLSKHVQKSQGNCTPLCDRIGAGRAFQHPGHNFYG